ncbi:MAG TPA: PaaI family thioesterase [Micromonosporaceae bacterium]|nr:PaaI family thioesterase [Micromonosporaceae bacterium]
MTETPPNGPVLDPRMLLEATPFAATVGIEFLALDPAEVTARLPWAAHRCTVGGALHGGALVTLADAAAGVCAYLNLPEGASTTTIELKVNFLRAVRGGVVTASARPLHAGRTVIVVQTDLRDEDGDRVAQVTQTQAVLR